MLRIAFNNSNKIKTQLTICLIILYYMRNNKEYLYLKIDLDWVL